MKRRKNKSRTFPQGIKSRGKDYCNIHSSPRQAAGYSGKVRDKKICIILGTRPEIIKMSPVIKECQKRKAGFFILHTNQHYSDKLDKIFFKELGLPKPKYNLNIGSGFHGEQTGKMIIKIEKILKKENPDIVLVQGDTNTVLAGALAATKMRIKIGHIEAGLRSYDKNMPEEINRILADHCSDYLFAPTKKAKKILINEGIAKDKIFVTGNTIVDAIYQNLKIDNSLIIDKLKLSPKNYFLLTIHRQENVDNKERFSNTLKGISIVYKKYKLPIIYPIHPRSEKMIKKFKIAIPEGAQIIAPVGYLDFLHLQKNAKLIFTDSGGVQEEACILKVPCITLRDNTERPETIDMGANILVGADVNNITKGVEIMMKRKGKWRNPFGNGKSAKIILSNVTRDFDK